MLENIKILLNIIDYSQDGLLTYLINTTQRKALDYTNQPELLIAMQSIVEEWVVIRYNKLGSEGLQSESYSGISQTFLSDIPNDIKAQLNKYRRLKTL